jgi:hypothetical protein
MCAYTKLIGQLFVMFALCCATAAAQPSAPGNTGNQTPTPPAIVDVYPRVWLTYYPGWEGKRWKEVAYADLTEWTTDKDVYLEYGAAEGQSSKPVIAPDTDARLSPDFKRQPQPPQFVWKVRYAAAATAGKSHLFITGYDGRTGRSRIYTDDDGLHFIYFERLGWREVGAEARLYRHWLDQQGDITSPLPTRSQ